MVVELTETQVMPAQSTLHQKLPSEVVENHLQNDLSRDWNDILFSEELGCPPVYLVAVVSYLPTFLLLFIAPAATQGCYLGQRRSVSCDVYVHEQHCKGSYVCCNVAVVSKATRM